MHLDFSDVLDAHTRDGFFSGQSWRLSPRAFVLGAEQLKTIETLGNACVHFYKACEQLYLKSALQKNILRNGQLRADWVAQLLDRGKPAWLVEHARAKALHGQMPMLIRPDLIMTETGFALTELDSVPGGVGITAFLNELYGEKEIVVGGKDAMIAGFARIIEALALGDKKNLVVIAVSEEAAAYRGEFEWLAARLRGRFSLNVRVGAAEELCAGTSENAIHLAGKNGAERVCGIYRFFELFDLEKLPCRDALLKCVETGGVQLSPPMRVFQEEKLFLALFWHPRLVEFWKQALPPKDLALLKAVIPPSWPVEPAENFPPHALIHGPAVGGVPLTDWAQLSRAAQKQRDYILKLSGFHPNAWGARSVTLGNDVPSQEWEASLKEALDNAHKHPFVLQHFEHPSLQSHAVFNEAGEVEDFPCRVRLCPYYFNVQNAVSLGGVLATACPVDKKIIHGMSAATLVPCAT